MNNKPWYSSITIWAGKAVIVLQVIPLVVIWLDANFGLSLQTNPVVINVLSAIGGAVAIYGRLTAKTILK